MSLSVRCTLFISCVGLICFDFVIVYHSHYSFTEYVRMCVSEKIIALKVCVDHAGSTAEIKAKSIMLWIQKEVKEMRGSLRCRDNRTLSLSSAMNVSQFKVHIHSHTSDRPPLGAIQACWCEVSQSCECVLVLLTRLYWLLNASFPVNWV